MVSWSEKSGSNYISDEIPEPLDAGQRTQDREFEQRRRFLAELRLVGLSEELGSIHMHDTNFVAILGVALEDEDHPLNYFTAEIEFFKRRAEATTLDSVQPTGQVYTQFDGISFGQTSRLRRKMWEDAE